MKTSRKTLYGIMFMLFVLYVIIGITLYNKYYETSPDSFWAYVCVALSYFSLIIGILIGEYSTKKELSLKQSVGTYKPQQEVGKDG